MFFLIIFQSKRPRKAVNYANDDLEIDDEGKSLDQGNQKRSNEEATEHETSRNQSLCGDATADFSRKNLQKGEDCAPDLSRDFQEAGGFMGVDKNERDQLDSRDDDPTSTDDFSKDYLTMGGGFCVDEDEKGDPANAGTIRENSDLEAELGTDPAQAVCSLQKFADELQSRPTCQPDTELNLDCPNATIGPSMPKNTGDDTGIKTVKALRAMPFLRKKRRSG